MRKTESYLKNAPSEVKKNYDRQRNNSSIAHKIDRY